MINLKDKIKWLTFFTFAGTAGDLQIQKLKIIEHLVSSFTAIMIYLM